MNIFIPPGEVHGPISGAILMIVLAMLIVVLIGHFMRGPM